MQCLQLRMKKMNPIYTYQFLKKLFLRQKDRELKLKLVELIGNVAAGNYVEVFRDSELESFLHEYGENLTINILPEKPKNNIVHVFSTIHRTGGHTRLVENMIK